MTVTEEEDEDADADRRIDDDQRKTKDATKKE